MVLMRIISPDFGNDRFEESVKLFQIVYKIDPRIEPVSIALKSYQQDAWIPLIYAIRTQGGGLIRAYVAGLHFESGVQLKFMLDMVK